MLNMMLGTCHTGLVQAILKEQGERYRQDYLPRARSFEGIPELFATLRSRNFRIGLATTSQPDELRHYLNLMNSGRPIDVYIDTMICGSDVRNEKPAPDIILEGMRRMSLPACRCWVVGDTPYDARAATAAQAMPIGTLTGGFSAETLERAGCAATIAIVTDLPDALSRIELNARSHRD